MPDFRTQFEPKKFRTIPADAGVAECPDMALRVAKDGTTYFEQVGVIPLYDRIQSHADSVDIELIVKRCMRGDTSDLYRRRGSYGDFTELPTTFAGMLDMVTRGEEFFNSLPLEEREKFDFSYGKWLASLDFANIGVRPADEKLTPSTTNTAVTEPVAPSTGVS